MAAKPFATPPEGWFTFGTHVGVPGGIEFSEKQDPADGSPLWERPVVAPSEPLVTEPLVTEPLVTEQPRAPLRAYDSDTNTYYDSMDQLIAARSEGYSVVTIMRVISARSKKPQIFARVSGIYTDKKSAGKKAAALRRLWRKRVSEELSDTELLSINIEPIWKDIKP